MRDGARRPTLKAPFPHCHLLSLTLHSAPCRFHIPHCSLSGHLRRLPDARRDHSPRVKKHLSHTTRRRLVLPLLRSLFAPAPPAHWHPRQKRTASSASPLAPSARPPAPSHRRYAIRTRSGGVAKVLDCLPSGTFWTSFWYSVFGHLCTQF